MNYLFWNCRGAGGREFPALIRDSARIYKLDMVAILEPQVSGDRADQIIKSLGFASSLKVDARGFSGGLWCLWRTSCPPIQVHSTSNFCIHLHVQANTPNHWFLSTVYASPRPYQRLEVWNELVDFHASILGPWCLAGDFNQVVYDWENQGGGPINAPARDAFSSCINSCHLLDLGFKGHPFT